VTAALSIQGAALSFGDRTLWSDLDLSVAPGEFVAVLGGNGSGKTSLLRAVLGMQRLDAGSIHVTGEAGYIPQQKLVAPGTPLRGRDLVTLGLTGTRFGLPIARRGERERVDALVASVGAEGYASRPVGTLSGGEQQRLRVAQALAADPAVLLCDEPLASLDLHHQRAVADLIDARRRDAGTAVLFVTHDVNPVLGMVDRILYLADGRFRIGTPDEVLRTEVLSALYGAPVEVFRSNGRYFVAGVPDVGEH
jgi:zinc/manganese transport system ATP-binding protein